MFKKDVNDALDLDHNSTAVKAFISNDFRYFTSLYARIQEAATGAQEPLEHVYFNRLNGMDSQNLLILSACVVDDDEEDEKIRLVAFHLDRLFALLRLQRAYDSNEFSDAVYEISNEIRAKPASAISPAFEKKLLELLSIRRGVNVLDAFEYPQFKNTSITDVPTRFTRYFFARLDAFLASGMNKPAYEVNDLVTKTGAVNGYHIEHIMSYNSDNIALYQENEEQFEIDRNRLGAVLLLKGKDNISSGNESYSDKLKSYAGTLYWNETLRKDAYKSKLDFTKLINQHQLAFEAYEKFGPVQIESRQKLLFALSKIIWS
jgi:hypothetical protein